MIDIKSQIIKPSLNLEDLRVVASAEGWGLTDLRSLHFFLNRNFKYRRKITITEQSGSDLTDYQVLIELNSTNFDFSHAQTNGEDIRFTDASGNLLDYWIEEWDAVNEGAKVWVKVPSIPANSSVEIFMYYGNSEVVDASDGDAVFEFFDDFWGTGIDTTKWDVYLPNQFTVSNGIVECVGSTKYPNLQTSNFQREAGESLSIEVKINVTLLGGDAYSGFVLAFTTADQTQFWGTGASDGVGWYTESGKYDRYVVFNGSGSWKPGDNRGLTTGEIRETVIITSDKIIHRASGARTFDDTFSGATNSTDAMSLRIFHTYDGYRIECDWVLVRKYASPEPSVSIGAEGTA